MQAFTAIARSLGGCAPREDSCDVLSYSVLVKTEALFLWMEKKHCHASSDHRTLQPMRNILLIVLILLLIGAFPSWGYSSEWGYYPFGGIGLVLLIVLILVLTGRL
jgi:Protein of unknown function (DUF3309)